MNPYPILSSIFSPFYTQYQSIRSYFFLLLRQKKKVAKKKRRFLGKSLRVPKKGSTLLSNLYLKLYSPVWRWFFTYRGLLLDIKTYFGDLLQIGGVDHILRQKKAPSCARGNYYYQYVLSELEIDGARAFLFFSTKRQPLWR
jgi:hypothetical protein